MRPADATARGSAVFVADFVSGLLDPERAVPDVVAGPRGKAATKRYGVYRNNVTVSLINALVAVYPATERITGADFFREMARSHVRVSPPSSPLLFEYGRDFPDFVAHYEPARTLPWLADVARVERAWLDAYHAADIAPLSTADLAAVRRDRLADAVLVPHPSARLVRSDYSALTIFLSNRSSEPVPRLDASAPEDTLVTRPHLDVVLRRLPPGGAVFLERLFAGESFGAATETAIDAAGEAFDLAANVAGMLDVGAFIEIQGGA